MDGLDTGENDQGDVNKTLLEVLNTYGNDVSKMLLELTTPTHKSVTQNDTLLQRVSYHPTQQ